MTTRARVRPVVDVETRDRLLRAAEALFAERGYGNVTVRDICHEARANVAAVNYYFGDKLGLYREVLQTAIDAVRATTEAGREAGIGHPPEEKLRRYIAVFLRRVLSADHHTVHRLIQRDLGGAASVNEALAPFRRQVEESGLSDDELGAFFEEVRDEVWQEKHGKAKNTS